MLFLPINELFRYPVLLAVDDFQALYQRSAYRDPHFREIHSFHLSIPRLILEYANAKRVFKRGAFIAALSTNNTRFRLPIELLEALQILPEQPLNSWMKRYTPYADYATGLQPFAIPSRLTLAEAAALFELWSNQGALHSGSSDFLALTTIN